MGPPARGRYRRERIDAVGASAARPAPGVLEAIADADVIVFPPSNPVVSIGTILQVPGIREALTRRRAPSSAFHRSSAARPCAAWPMPASTAIGVETTAAPSPSTTAPALLDGWLVDDVDAGSMEPPLDGIAVRSRPLLMVDLDATAAIARGVLDLAADLRA